MVKTFYKQVIKNMKLLSEDTCLYGVDKEF